MKRYIRPLLISLVAAVMLVNLSLPAVASHADKVVGKKVLVVMSYHQGSEGEQKIKEGLESSLAGARIKYLWMNTKKDLAGGEAKAAEAFRLYQEFRPDAVIAADDNAQSLFVVPYLKDKVDTPVIFCGVNDEATAYGFPATNVTGVLEKKHYRESIGFARIIVPTIEKIAFVYKDNPTNRKNLAQIEKEKDSYSAEIAGKYPVSSMLELEKVLSGPGLQVDALFLLNLAGVVDQKGLKLEGADVVGFVVNNYAKPTIGASGWEIRAGVLCGVIKDDMEQGTLAARLLKKIWQGRAVADSPVTWNKNGPRLLNLTTLKKLGMKPSPEAIIGTELITVEVKH